MTNGVRSQHNYFRTECSTHQIPVDEIMRIKTVILYNFNIVDDYESIIGFQFFDKKNKLILEVGRIEIKSQTMVLKENEHIIGVVAKLVGQKPYFYSNF